MRTAWANVMMISQLLGLALVSRSLEARTSQGLGRRGGPAEARLIEPQASLRGSPGIEYC